MADIFEQMKRGAHLLMVLETMGNSGIAFSLTQSEGYRGRWVFETADRVCRSEGFDVVEVMEDALGVVARWGGKNDG